MGLSTSKTGTCVHSRCNPPAVSQHRTTGLQKSGCDGACFEMWVLNRAIFLPQASGHDWQAAPRTRGCRGGVGNGHEENYCAWRWWLLRLAYNSSPGWSGVSLFPCHTERVWLRVPYPTASALSRRPCNSDVLLRVFRATMWWVWTTSRAATSTRKWAAIRSPPSRCSCCFHCGVCYIHVDIGICLHTYIIIKCVHTHMHAYIRTCALVVARDL